MDNSNPRHWLMLGLVLMLLLCAGFGVAAFVWVGGTPPGTLLGRVGEYPPSDEPYRVQVENQFVFVVNVTGTVQVLEPRFTSSNGAWNCDVKWVPTNGRFEDPCSGAKFALTGAWLDPHVTNVSGQSVLDNIEHRGLSSYPVRERAGKLYVQLGWPIPSPLATVRTPAGTE